MGANMALRSLATAASVCRIGVEECGVKALYIIDVLPPSPTFFGKAVRELFRRRSQSIDLMLYVDSLPFVPWPLLRVPHSKKPRRVRMCGRLLVPGIVDDRIWHIENWNVNISNFDVR
jgi:hypothetical protein